MRAEIVEREAPATYPIRETFFGCCAWAAASLKANVTTKEVLPLCFDFGYFDQLKQVFELHYRKKNPTIAPKIFYSFFSPNRESFDDLVRSRCASRINASYSTKRRAFDRNL